MLYDSRLRPLFTQLLFKAMLANCLNRLEDNFHNNRLTRALGHWRLPRIARAWNKWFFLWSTRDRYLQRVFVEHARDQLVRGQIRLVMAMWYNIQGYKAWNSWKAAYVKSAAQKKHKSTAAIENEAERAEEEENPAERAAQVRSLKKLMSRRTGFNEAGEMQEELPAWVPVWAIFFYQIWTKVKRRVIRFCVASYHSLKRFARSQSLDDISTCVVGVNVFFMTLPHTYDSAFGEVWDSTQEHARFHSGLDILNIIVAIFFLGELALKLWGWGPREYAMKLSNIFDLVITIISAVEIPAMFSSAICKFRAERLRDCNAAMNFMLLRVLRLLRLVRVLRAFPNFQSQMRVAVAVLGEVAASFGLLCLFLVVYSILGCSLFGGRLREEFHADRVLLGERVYVRLADDVLDKPGILVAADAQLHPYNPWKVALVEGFSGGEDLSAAQHVWLSDGSLQRDLGLQSAGVMAGEGFIVGVSPRSGFDTLLQSLVCVFQILGGSGWPDVMQNAVESTDFSSLLYFYSLIFVGSLVLYNLFAAVIIVAFNRHKDIKDKVERLDRMPFLEVKLPPQHRKKKGIFGRLTLLIRLLVANIRRVLLGHRARLAEDTFSPLGATSAVGQPAGVVGAAASGAAVAGAGVGAGGGGAAAGGGGGGDSKGKPVKSSDKRRQAKMLANATAIGVGPTKTSFFAQRVEMQQSLASLVGRELWKRKIDVLEENDRRQFEEEERERRMMWRYRSRSLMFEKFKKRDMPRQPWADTRAKPNEFIRGVVVEYSDHDGYKVVYRTEDIVGYDLEEHLKPHEMDKRIAEQEHLHYVQSEFARQQKMDSWQLGRHLASNLEVAVALLEDKLMRIRALEQQVLQSTELKAELEKVVKASFRISH